MQFSENWLRTMANPDIRSEQLAHLLTMSGLEVEEVGAVAPAFSNVVVAEVLETSQHPNADRLTVCRIDAGLHKHLTVVCGASNVGVGLKVACALPGAILPPAKDAKPIEIKVGQLRGVESEGMLCSARELGITEDHAGILVLPVEAPVGKDIRAYLDLDDAILTLKLTPNRADCLSILGVARETSALTGTVLSLPVWQSVAATFDERLPVKLSAPDLCGRFAGRVIRGLDARAKTPEWIKQRLERCGQRCVSALVDISNYVMLELGQPTHVFDLAKIQGGLEVRWGRQGEALKLLGGAVVTLDDRVGVVADGRAVQSLAGIMGGDAASVSFETQDVYIEAAFWHPHAIQGRTRRFNIATDAAHRFERGVDAAATVECLERVTALIVEICGQKGLTQVGPVDDQVINTPSRNPVQMRLARAVRVIGVPLDEARVTEIFTRLGLTHSYADGVFTVTPPAYRFDLEIEEDLIEEVARVFGYENIPALPPVAPNILRLPPERQRSVFAIRRLLAAFDYQEVVNYSFVDAAWEMDFAGNAAPVKVVNPIASHMSTMRSTLVGSLIANLRYNLNRKVSRIRLFELGAVFMHDASVADGPLSVAGFDQPKRVAAIACGGVVEEQWGQPVRVVDFFDMKADLEALFAPNLLRFETTQHPALHPGRCARVMLDERDIGFIGELHPRWQQKYELTTAPIVFEITMAALEQRQVPVHQEISRFPAAVRDLALLVPQTISAQHLIDTFNEQARNNALCNILQAVVLFDEYRGKGLTENEKSLAFRFTLQDTHRTLQDDAVDAAMHAFVEAAQEKYGAKRRT
ncbi:MAG: phenylalanine--tRNA ligase subunit beta [Pseudomonadota bacterium]